MQQDPAPPLKPTSVAKPAPLLLDNDTASIIASYLAEKPYRLRKELEPYKHYIPFAIVKHPAVTHYVNKSTIEFYVNNHRKCEKHNPGVLKTVFENPYLADIIREMVDEDNKALVDNISTLCAFENPDIIRLIERHVHLVNKRGRAGLTINPMAVSILEKNINKIKWFKIGYNKAAGHIIKAHIDRIPPDGNFSPWSSISRTQTDLSLFRENFDRIDWYELSLNPAAVPFLSEYPYCCDWYGLSRMPEAIDIIRANINLVDWYELALNPAAIDILEAHPDKIEFRYLCENPAAVPLLRKNMDKIDWTLLCKNPSADIIPLLRENVDKINWAVLLSNNKFVPNDLILENIDKAYIHLLNFFMKNNNPEAANLIFECDIDLYNKKINDMADVVSNIDIRTL